MDEAEVGVVAGDSVSAVPFEKVEEREKHEIALRRDKFDIPPLKDQTLGLAISGGGIRSATFSLGVLQRLAEVGVLKHVDYFSTVSGGGYIGAWLCSWLRREQTKKTHKDERIEFERVRCSLSVKQPSDAPEEAKVKKNGDEAESHESPKITFLREYSNYLTPHVSVFSADTWVVGAIWVRNTLLNLCILVALFASLVLLVRYAGLHWFGGLNPSEGNSDWVGLLALSVAPLAPMVGLIGWNLWRNSTIALQDVEKTGGAKTSLDTEKAAGRQWVIAASCLLPLLSALVYSFWLAQSEGLFIKKGLLHGVEDNFWAMLPAYLLIQVCARTYDFNIGSAKKITNWVRLGAVLIGLTSSLVPAFVTAALLRGIAFIFSMMQHSHSDQLRWFVFTFGPPFVLLAFTIGIVTHIGLMGRDLPESSREWLGRLGAWLTIFQAAWIAVVGISIYGPWLLALIWVKSWVAIATLGTGWVVGTAAGLFAGNSDKTSGKPQTEGKRQTSKLEIVARLGPYVFMLGFLLLVALGAHAILVHGLEVQATPPSAATIERYDLQARNGNVQFLHQETHVNDTGLQWVYARYWRHLTNTKVWISDIPANKDLWQLSGLGALLALLVAAGGLLAWRVDVNLFSLHNFYRNRLVRCYLGASRQSERRPNPFTGFDDSDDTPLDRFTAKNGYYGPYPIINAALNVTSGGKLQYQQRQAESFIFTPLYSGFSAGTTVNEMRLGDEPVRRLASYKDDGGSKNGTEAAASPEAAPPPAAYRPTSSAGGGVTLGNAMAISGAAVSPNMGYHTSTAVSFLLTVFNVRLGWWFGNALKNSFQNPGPTFGLVYALRELLGLANADSRYVNLSDGGHFDNMGIYELVRRRCRYIICCDAEQDEELHFDGIGNAIRKCRTDFGVDIDLPLTPIQKENGFSRAHCVIGRIKYPDQHGEDGYLLYLKASLTGDEATDVLNYRSQAPNFPHQTTADQWFDESQFESYRKLGLHIAEKALGTQTLKNQTRECFFKNLFQIWY